MKEFLMVVCGIFFGYFMGYLYKSSRKEHDGTMADSMVYVGYPIIILILITIIWII